MTIPRAIQLIQRISPTVEPSVQIKSHQSTLVKHELSTSIASAIKAMGSHGLTAATFSSSQIQRSVIGSRFGLRTLHKTSLSLRWLTATTDPNTTEDTPSTSS